MRLWSLHPKYLDRAGLVALWREALLAQAVLRGMTRGYRRQPQLIRFRNHPDPEGAIAAYLEAIRREAASRGYRFDAARIGPRRPIPAIPVTDGQLLYERAHLRKKLHSRSPDACRSLGKIGVPEAHPLFRIVAGDVEAWEIIQTNGRG